MRILIVSAWLPEQEWLRETFNSTSSAHELNFLLTGVGSVRAAAAVSRSLQEKKEIDCVIFCGTAGYYPNYTFSIGDVVQSQRVIEQDIGYLEGKSYLPQTTTLECAPHHLSVKLSFTCLSTPSITKNNTAAEQFGKIGELENLEFLGVAVAAQNNKKNWMGYFGLSNVVGSSSHDEWKQNHLSASLNAQKHLWQKIQATL